MKGPAVYFGPLEAERFLRPKKYAKLPALMDSGWQTITSSLDELQFVFCGKGDILLTQYAIPAAQMDYLQTTGYAFEHNLEDLSFPDESKKMLEAYEAWLGEREISGISVFSYLPYLSSLCRRRAVACDYPAFSVIRKVNSKRYSTALSHTLGFSDRSLSRAVRGSEELFRAGMQMMKSGAILVKDPWGVSGKGNLLIEDEPALRRICRFLQKQEERGLASEWVVEHCFDKKADFSCQFYIERDGTVRMFGVRQVLNDRFSYRGTCEGTRELNVILERQRYMDKMEMIAESLYRDGYFGHVCVDSLLCADDTVIPCIEINGRKSMSLIKYTLDERLDFPHQSVFLFDSLVIPKDFRYEFLLEALQKSGVLYRSGAQTGIFPMTACAITVGKAVADGARYRARLYYMLIGRNTEEALALRTDMKRVYEALSIQI